MKKSWLHNYLQFTKDQESPEIFHLWSGLGVLSTVIGRNIYLRRSYNIRVRTYPNLYIVLVAPPGRCKKGGALKFAKDMINEVGSRVYSGAITKRALTQDLSNQIVLINKAPQGESKLTIMSDELEVFLGKQAIMDGLFALLCDLYDCPDKWEYRTSTQGCDYLYNTLLIVVGGTIPGWFNMLPPEVMSSGFLSRICIIAQTSTPRRNSGVNINNKDVEKKVRLEEELKAFLIRLKEVKHEIFLSPSAAQFYDDWYNNRDEPQDERFASFYEREHDHVIKVAILLSASYGDFFSSDVVGKERIGEAIMMLEKVKDCMHLAYIGIGEGVAAKGYGRVLEQLKEAGGKMDHSELLRKNYYYVGDKEGFKKLMDLVIETERVKMGFTKTGRRYYTLIKEREV
jgi:Fe-S cluster biosynthesis and repair protein YggX